MGARTCAMVLREKLTDEGYEALDEMITQRQQNLLTVDKFDARLTEFSAEVRGEIQQLRADIRIDIAERSAELMKWAMVFWVAQAAAVAGIVAALR